MGMGYPLPIQLEGLGERRKLPRRGPRGGAPDENENENENDFSAFTALQNALGCTA